MESVVLVMVAGAMCIWSFVIGAKVGQTVSKGNDIKMPSVNPMDAVKNRKAKKDAEMEQNRLDTILRNIEGYDGTGFKQEDVPGR